MLIEGMSHESCIELLKSTHRGRLACSRGAQPYITVFSFTFDDEYLYGFSAIGKKIEWMRANPLVCIEADEIIARDDWRSVVIFGRYEELRDTPEFCEKRVAARELLAKTPTWWEPGAFRTADESAERSFESIFFRLTIDEITGHHAFAEPR